MACEYKVGLPEPLRKPPRRVGVNPRVATFQSKRNVKTASDLGPRQTKPLLNLDLLSATPDHSKPLPFPMGEGKGLFAKGHWIQFGKCLGMVGVSC